MANGDETAGMVKLSSWPQWGRDSWYGVAELVADGDETAGME